MDSSQANQQLKKYMYVECSRYGEQFILYRTKTKTLKREAYFKNYHLSLCSLIKADSRTYVCDLSSEVLCSLLLFVPTLENRGLVG